MSNVKDPQIGSNTRSFKKAWESITSLPSRAMNLSKEFGPVAFICATTVGVPFGTNCAFAHYALNLPLTPSLLSGIIGTASLIAAKQRAINRGASVKRMHTLTAVGFMAGSIVGQGIAFGFNEIAIDGNTSIQAKCTEQKLNPGDKISWEGRATICPKN